MSFKFTKMQGLGNDFVVIDAVTQPVDISQDLARQLADRHYGVGCDQVLIVERYHGDAADFNYRIFNADGSEVAQCGNGARCVGRFIKEKLSDKKNIRLATKSSVLKVSVEDDGLVQLSMSAPSFEPESIPFEAQVASRKHDDSVTFSFGETVIDCGVVSVGNPHAVMVVSAFDIEKMNVNAKFLGSHPAFPEGVNVGFMKIISPDRIELQVYERGVGFTKACGSGACAAVVIGRMQGLLGSVVEVSQPGGSLRVQWDGADGNILLTGSAEFVFEGSWGTF